MKQIQVRAITLLITIATASFVCQKTYGASPYLEYLYQGVNEITVCGSPGAISVFGPDAMTVIAGESGKNKTALVGAAQYGSGRIIVFGHDGYLGADAMGRSQTGQFMKNCIRWSAGGRQVFAGIYNNPKLRNYLSAEINAVDTDLNNMGNFNVLVINSHQIQERDLAKIERFVAGGGGLITAGTGWGWKYLNPGKELNRDYPANKLLARAGLVIADGLANKTTANGYAANEPSALINAFTALQAVFNMANPTKEQAGQISSTLITAIRSVPENDQIILPKLRNIKPQKYPSVKDPVRENDIYNRIALSIEMEQISDTPVEYIRAHRTAAEFPGFVPGNIERVTRQVEIDLSVPRWHSTGLYAGPGEHIMVSIPQAAINSKLKVRIGCHKDTLWDKDKWSRMPEITRVFDLDKVRTEAANAFGGLVYIEVPDGLPAQKAMVAIAGAVDAPRYVKGVTTAEQWQQIRQYPGPWGEVETGNIIVSVPSSNLRELSNPEELCETWDKVLDACADLATIDRNRKSPERIVPDLQISVGYMHSGYPIMTLSDQFDKLTDVNNLMAGSWGLYHELGHNHQNRDWTFDGTVEVTVNLFTLYVYDKVCGISPENNERSNEAAIAKHWRDYNNHGKDFNYWKSEPFLGLAMYVQLQQKFGWDSFKKVFAEYRKLPKGQRPANDDQKRDQWLVRYSKQVGHNLGPFFEMWNIPVSNRAKAAIKNLPVWMPEK